MLPYLADMPTFLQNSTRGFINYLGKDTKRNYFHLIKDKLLEFQKPFCSSAVGIPNKTTGLISSIELKDIWSQAPLFIHQTRIDIFLECKENLTLSLSLSLFSFSFCLSLKLYWKIACVSPQNFHTRKLGEVMVFYAVSTK